MKRLLTILLLVFSVGVGDVYAGDHDKGLRLIMEARASITLCLMGKAKIMLAAAIVSLYALHTKVWRLVPP
jgi:uncharacterized membrane-anchored protein